MGYLADTTAHSKIGYWHDNVVCLSVHLSVRDAVHCALLLTVTFYSKGI